MRARGAWLAWCVGLSFACAPVDLGVPAEPQVADEVCRFGKAGEAERAARFDAEGCEVASFTYDAEARRRVFRSFDLDGDGPHEELVWTGAGVSVRWGGLGPVERLFPPGVRQLYFAELDGQPGFEVLAGDGDALRVARAGTGQVEVLAFAYDALRFADVDGEPGLEVLAQSADAVEVYQATDGERTRYATSVDVLVRAELDGDPQTELLLIGPDMISVVDHAERAFESFPRWLHVQAPHDHDGLPGDEVVTMDASGCRRRVLRWPLRQLSEPVDVCRGESLRDPGAPRP